MAREFAVKTKNMAMAAAFKSHPSAKNAEGWGSRRAVISLVMLAMVMMPATLRALGPALTTVSEVRYSDAGWGADNNRNLVGRFTNRTLTLTRYARAQNYFLRSYDGSVPAKYSRYSTALHVDYPL